MARYHLHQSFKILYVDEGYGRFQMNQQCVALKPGSLVILDAHFPHVTEVDQGTGLQRTVCILAGGPWPPMPTVSRYYSHGSPNRVFVPWYALRDILKTGRIS
jgi:hypothetical protein